MGIQLNKLITLDSLALNFGVKSDFLRQVIESEDQEVYYEVLAIPKKNKKNKYSYRHVYKADYRLALFHKNLLKTITKTIYWTDLDDYIHPSAHGFVKKRNTRTNAEQHLDKRVLIQLDIKSWVKTT